ncbi:MAG: glycoside hydrolase family 5 protein [Wujia sp.]
MRKFEGFTRGINLGGWLSQCRFEKEHMDGFITRDDIRKISGMGADHVRLPIDFELIEDEEGNEIETGYQYIDNAVSWSIANNLNLVLDLHKTAGYVFDDAGYSSDFFHSEKLQDRFIHLWEKLARRYGGYPDHIAFELLNEVVDAECRDEWNRIAERTIKVIRGMAPDTWILLGGTRSNSVSTIRDLGKPYDDRIAYNFHCYEPLIFTHQSAFWVENMPLDYVVDYPKPIEFYISENNRLIDSNYAQPILPYADLMAGKEFFRAFFAEAVRLGEMYDVPLYCGEYGVIDKVSPENTLKWFRDIHEVFEEYGIGRAVWNYKEMNFGITGEHYAPIYDDILTCL